MTSQSFLSVCVWLQYIDLFDFVWGIDDFGGQGIVGSSMVVVTGPTTNSLPAVFSVLLWPCCFQDVICSHWHGC